MKILIADDSRTAGRRLQGILETLGHQVTEQATTGSMAVRLFQQEQPDALFLDIVMPEMDGLSALRAIRAIDKRVPAVIVSSTAGVGSTVDEALRLGATSVISKPYTSDDVQQALGKLVSGA